MNSSEFFFNPLPNIFTLCQKYQYIDTNCTCWWYFFKVWKECIDCGCTHIFRLTNFSITDFNSQSPVDKRYISVSLGEYLEDPEGVIHCQKLLLFRYGFQNTLHVWYKNPAFCSTVSVRHPGAYFEIKSTKCPLELWKLYYFGKSLLIHNGC